MERPVIVNPPDLPEPVGFAHAVVAGRTIHLGGQIGEGFVRRERWAGEQRQVGRAGRLEAVHGDGKRSEEVFVRAIAAPVECEGLPTHLEVAVPVDGEL